MAYKIVAADEARMAEVESWLDQEEAIHAAALADWESNDYEGDIPVRGFRCNWDSVKRAWRKGEAQVDVLILEDMAVGFLDGTDILEIRPGFRQKGYGRILAEFMLGRAYNENRSLIEIEIAPSSAECFWKCMGFTTVPDRRGNGGGIYAFKIFPRTFLLTEGERVPYSVEFYAEREAYKDDPKPISRFAGLGERLSDGSIQLIERAYCFDPNHSGHDDFFVKIDVDTESLHFFDKAKRQESKFYGVDQDCGYTYFVDRLLPKSC